MKATLARGLRMGVALGVVAGSCYLAYSRGYEAGRKSKGPDFRGMAVHLKGGGRSYSWYDVSIPDQAEGLRLDEAMRKAAGTEFSIVEGEAVTSARPAPDPRRVDAHR